MFCLKIYKKIISAPRTSTFAAFINNTIRRSWEKYSGSTIVMEAKFDNVRLLLHLLKVLFQLYKKNMLALKTTTFPEFINSTIRKS